MKIAVGYFLATPPIAGYKAVADLFQINAEIYSGLTIHILGIIVLAATEFHLNIAEYT